MGIGKRKRISRVVLLGALFPVALASCNERVDSMLLRLLRTEDPPEEYDEASEATIEELEEDVAALRETVDDHFEAMRDLRSAHRALGMRYLEEEMYGAAVEQFEAAAEIDSGNATIYYYTGVAAGNHAGGALDEEERSARLEQAERAYLRALELRSRYPAAAYGLAILYAYELDRPDEARTYVDRVLDWRGQDSRARAVSAYIYAAQGRIDEALREYDRVIEETDDEEFREEAMRMRRELEERQ